MSYLFIYIRKDSLVEMEERMKITGNDAKGTPPPQKKMEIFFVGEGGEWNWSARKPLNLWPRPFGPWPKLWVRVAHATRFWVSRRRTQRKEAKSNDTRVAYSLLFHKISSQTPAYSLWIYIRIMRKMLKSEDSTHYKTLPDMAVGSFITLNLHFSMFSPWFGYIFTDFKPVSLKKWKEYATLLLPEWAKIRNMLSGC